MPASAACGGAALLRVGAQLIGRLTALGRRFALLLSVGTSLQSVGTPLLSLGSQRLYGSAALPSFASTRLRSIATLAGSCLARIRFGVARDRAVLPRLRCRAALLRCTSVLGGASSALDTLRPPSVAPRVRLADM